MHVEVSRAVDHKRGMSLTWKEVRVHVGHGMARNARSGWRNEKDKPKENIMRTRVQKLGNYMGLFAC